MIENKNNIDLLIHMSNTLINKINEDKKRIPERLSDNYLTTIHQKIINNINLYKPYNIYDTNNLTNYGIYLQN